MPFDPLSWAIGFVLNTVLKKSAETLLERKGLADKLEQVVKSWADMLPADLAFHPDALFSRLPIPTSNVAWGDLAPAATALGTALANGRIPSCELWRNALLERWTVVRQQLGRTAAPFFRLPEKKAAEHLDALATRLARACQEDQALFQVTMLAHLEAQRIADSPMPSELRLHILDSRIEAPGYDPLNAHIRFTVSNLTPHQIKITDLRLTVLARTPRRHFRLPTVGAPHEEFELHADLSLDEHDLLSATKVQFVLKPGDADAFSIRVLGHEGYEYKVTVACKADSLSSTLTYDAASEQVTVLYPIRTVEGLRRHDEKST